MMNSPAQRRAARALLDIVPRDTIADFEIGSRTPRPDRLAGIRAAFEAAGVIFIDENGEGPGVRLRKKRAP